MATVFPTQNLVVARLRFRLQRETWTEKYFLGSGTPQDYLATLDTLCAIRASWMGAFVSIDYAAASDLGTSRDSVMTSFLPVINRYSAIRGACNDVNVGYEYRLQKVTGNKYYRVFRGIPDIYIQQNLAVGGPWFPNQGGGAQGTFADGRTGTWYNPLDNGVVGGVVDTTFVNGERMARGFLNFLCQKTVSATFNPLSVPAWTNNGLWDQVLYRGIRTRRTGQSWEAKKGRFQR